MSSQDCFETKRPSTDSSSLRLLVAGRPESIRSTGSRLGVQRHALLKSFNKQTPVTEKDLPVPPVLSRVDTPGSIIAKAGPKFFPSSKSQSRRTSRASSADVDTSAPADQEVTLVQNLKSDVEVSISGIDAFKDVDFDSDILFEPCLRHQEADTEPTNPTVFPRASKVKSTTAQIKGCDFEESADDGCLSRQESDAENRQFEDADIANFQGAHNTSCPRPSFPDSCSSTSSGGKDLSLQDLKLVAKGSVLNSCSQRPGLSSDLAQQHRETNQQGKTSPGRTTVSVPSDEVIVEVSAPDAYRKSLSGSNIEPSLAAKRTRTRQLSRERSNPELLISRLEPRRAAIWMQEILGIQASSKPALTELPAKVNPRHRGRAESENDDNALSQSTRATTFSDKHAQEVTAMDSAMHRLETLLGEALQVASQAAQQDEYDDDVWQPDGQTSSGSIRECARGDASVDSDFSIASIDTRSSVFQGVFVGAVPGLSHGCDALPLRAVKAYGFATINDTNGNLTGPLLPERGSSLRMHTSYHTGHPAATLQQTLEEPAPLFIQPNGTHHMHSSSSTRGLKHAQDPTQQSIKTRLQLPASHTEQCLKDVKTSFLPSGYGSLCSLDGGISDSADMRSPPRNLLSKSGRRRIPESEQQTAELSRHAQLLQRHPSRKHASNLYSLRGKSHVSIDDIQRFSLTKTHKSQPLARDWSPVRKRFTAAVACISTALIGMVIGIYAGMVPGVQYYLADFHHYSIVGNVGLYLGIALPTLFCWPLPLLHGRKPYILASFAISMPLLFPQAISVVALRSPNTSAWRWALFLPRAVMGAALGFANMNFHAILTDLFGASLMSTNPHQEMADDFDVRRHGGGLGVWLGIWTWCWIGSLSIGFMIGAIVIDSLTPSWGFYISIALIAVALLLNIFAPEVRRSAWRRSVAEVSKGDKTSRRVARGEIMMHRVKDGPKWWGQEVYHGTALMMEMLRQPGFLIMGIYAAWIYAQVVLMIVLLGSLSSRYYRLQSPLVGAAVSSVAVGALFAVPFQKANVFSRARYHPQTSNQMTINKRMTWTSHLLRRAIFTITLPAAAAVYAVVSFGPPVHLIFPCLLAFAVGFLSCLAISECSGLLMETWDCSDLQRGMTGRSKSKHNPTKRTNYSSFPRVQAGFAFIHSLGFVFAAGATGLGGTIQRNLGQRAATAVVASILFILTLFLLLVLIRFRKIEIIPRTKTEEMDKWIDHCHRIHATAATQGQHRHVEIPGHGSTPWRPLIIGNPLEKMRRMNILEFGSLTRWTEIRKQNRLIDKGAHVNRQAMDMAREELEQTGIELLEDIQRGGAIVGDLVRRVSRRSMRSRASANTSSDSEGDSAVRSRPRGHTAPAATGAGLGHRHAATASPDIYMERDCFWGQAVPEELEDTSVKGRTLASGHILQ